MTTLLCLFMYQKTIKMEYCPASLSAIGQLYPERISENRSGMWHMFNRSVHRSEVVCPEPRRISRSPFISDGCNKLFYKTKSVLPAHGGESLGILDFILCRDDPEGEYDSSPNQMGFFCGSPPVRTSNPLIHDAMFEKETAVEAPLGYHPPLVTLTLARIEKAPPASSPLRNSHGLQPPASTVDGAAALEPFGKVHGGGKPTVVNMESCGSSVGGKPKVRIEGFASGKSDSNCVVPAFA